MYDTSLLERYCKSLGVTLEKEYKFVPRRRFRADYAIREWRILIEVEGGVWTRGRHFRGKGAVQDMAKYNLATVHGYQLLRFTPSQFKETQGIEWLNMWYNQRIKNRLTAS
jgi:very-short-patch-repair endonuclease